MHQAEEEKPEGAPEWMVSYADMITIVMSFFVVMFSIASGEVAKGRRTQQQQAVIDSLGFRFGPKWKPFTSWVLSPGNSILPGGGKGLGSSAPVSAVGDPGGTLRVLKREKKRIRVPGEGDLVAIGGPIYFDAATANLSPKQDKDLQAIADELKGKPQEVEIVATASPQPLPKDNSFHDSWNLGFARCRRMAELLAGLEVEPKRLRLSVLPAGGEENKNESHSEADVTVRVFLSASLPAGAK